MVGKAEHQSSATNGNKVVAFISGAVVNHVNAFLLGLDATKDVTTLEEAKQLGQVKTGNRQSVLASIAENLHYFIPLVVMWINIGDGLLILAKENFKYNQTGMADLWTHRIFEKPFWFTGTVIIHIVIFMNTCVFTLLVFKSKVEGKYIIFALKAKKKGQKTKVIQNGKAWKQKYADRFLAFRERARSTVRVVQATVYILALPYWYMGLVKNFTVDVRHLVCFAYLPFFILYSAFGAVFVSFYIMLAANYMTIQQTFLLEKIESLTGKVVRANAQYKMRMPSVKVWKRFTRINNEIFSFFEQLNANNAFWAPYLSTYFACHVSMEVFLFYGFIFDRTAFDWLKRSYFLYFTVEFMVLLIAITWACSALVRRNVKIYKTNITFCYAFSKNYQPVPIYLLKMSKMISNHKGMRNGLRLINNYIVDSKMFEIIFFYISTIFMKVFTD